MDLAKSDRTSAEVVVAMEGVTCQHSRAGDDSPVTGGLKVDLDTSNHGPTKLLQPTAFGLNMAAPYDNTF